MTKQEDADAAETLALQALAWVVSDARLGSRLLALTGMDGGSLHDQAGDPETLAAVLAFLQDHEPDLTACAEALGCPPSELTHAHEVLTR